MKRSTLRTWGLSYLLLAVAFFPACSPSEGASPPDASGSSASVKSPPAGSNAAPAGPDAPPDDPNLPVADSGVPEALADCVPIEAAFETNALPVFEARCLPCHGSTPLFGAPFSLLDYAPLVEGAPGERIVDRIVAALVDDIMPPPNAGDLTHEQLDTLAGWASCGLVHPDTHDQTTTDREVFAAPSDPPGEATPVDLTMEEIAVGPNDLDRYESRVFRNVVDGDRFIRRFEPVVDDGRVVHHLTLRLGAGDSRRYLYAWAPGGQPVELPGGGIRLRPSDTLEVEVHYNNGAGASDVRDSSGVRIYLDEPQGTEYGMSNPASWDIFVPANSMSTASQSCTVRSAATIVAAMPHMHEVGDSFEHVRVRGGQRETIVALDGWSFDNQQFYTVNMDLEPGDRLEMTCRYDNPSGSGVRAGPGTGDEMCFDFMYVTPAGALTECDDNISL